MHEKQNADFERDVAARVPGIEQWYWMERAFIRALRIAVGIPLFLIGFWLLFWAWEVVDIPFAALTLGALLGAILKGGFGVLLTGWSLKTVFGAAPNKREEIRSKAEAAVRAEYADDAKAAGEEGEMAARYAKSRFWGTITDPGIGGRVARREKAQRHRERMAAWSEPAEPTTSAEGWAD